MKTNKSHVKTKAKEDLKQRDKDIDYQLDTFADIYCNYLLKQILEQE